MRIGICGGTFDPFHRGHLEPVLAVRDAMQWEQVVYVPAWRQPFKLDHDSASGFHRYAMAALATDELESVSVSAWELERECVSYTVETLAELRARYGEEATLDWIIGDDNLPNLGEWKALDRIFELANFAVLARTAAEAPAPYRNKVTQPDRRHSHGAIVFTANETIPISSTEIRRRVRDGQRIDDLVDPRVSRYIHKQGLYKGNM